MQGWLRAKQVFQEALELSPQERPAYVARACGGDADLQREVESLLTELAAAGDFMESPAAQWMSLSSASAAPSSANKEPRLQPGAEVGPYQVRALLGRGGMGEVYRAWDPRLGREVALKVLLPEVAGDEESIRRFEQEARAASALNHPAILTVHDVGRAGPMLYIVTELVQGHTLRELIRLGPLSLPHAADGGLADCRRAGQGPRPRRGPPRPQAGERDADRGRLRADPRLRPGQAAAERPGRARPVHLPRRPADGHRWATCRRSRRAARRWTSAPTSSPLGAMLYELASGKPAFPRTSMAETLAATLHQQPAPLAAAAPSLPAGLVQGGRPLPGQEPAPIATAARTSPPAS